MKPRHPCHFIGLAGRIASILFNAIPVDPFSDALDRCWLFSGPPGSGKSSLALALAAKLTGENINALHAGRGYSVETLNGQSLTIEVVRKWRADGHYVPLSGIAVKIIDEIDAGSLAAFNECRSWLDQLPSHTIVIATTNREPEALQPQLQSRFQLYRFKPVSAEAITALLVSRFSLDADTAQTYAIGCQGNVRAALLDAKAHVRTAAIA